MKRNLILPCFAVMLVLGIIVYAFLNSATIPLLTPQGPVALQEQGVLVLTILLSAIVVVPIFWLLFYVAWRYRASNTKVLRKHQPNWDHDNWKAEFVWWLVPTVIVFFLGILAWQSSHALDPYKSLVGKNPEITIEVIALNWKWLFIYPEQGIATVNMLEIPVDTPIHFKLTADAPMNSFWIPSLGGQIMAMPGMSTELNLLASAPGTFIGSSANISGKGFSGMNFMTRAVSTIDFQSWVQLVQQNNTVLDEVTYAELAKPSENVPAMSYASIDPNLYTKTIMSYMMGPDSMNMVAPTTP